MHILDFVILVLEFTRGKYGFVAKPEIFFPYTVTPDSRDNGTQRTYATLKMAVGCS
jgi:hypothetical protein